MTEFQVKYFDGNGNLSHEYTEHFEYDDFLFCPNCAARAVWVDQSGGDFYVGENHVCIECGTVFCLPIIRCASDDEQDRQRVEGIKRGLTMHAPDGSKAEPKCLCPSDGIYPGCPVHGSRRR